MFFEVKYTKTPGIPRCPYHYHCEGRGNKYQAVRNGKGREKCLKAGEGRDKGGISPVSSSEIPVQEDGEEFHR